MQFTRLRVLGFKSFVEPTEFLIEPGLTGVVGPNGCGKSNLLEALRWVMGESSYKNMRASGMDDVIFSGSVNRPARNTAEVSLAADNSDRTAPAGFNDTDALEITRRIERDTGSAYKINGRDVRARDVQLLFADASTGAHSPSMVGQGRIGELIAAKPTDRRRLLEEAAGISGLHNRRHEAELRLRAADTNLSRLDDVIVEIETQLQTVKRQARQAVRYRNLSGDIRRAEATVLHLRWLEAGSVLAEAEEDLAKSTSEAIVRATEQVEAARVQADAAAVVPELRDAAAAAGAAIHRITLAQTALDAEEARIRERIEAIERHLAELGEDIERERRMVGENEAVLARLDAEERDLEAANAATADRQACATKRLAAADQELATSEGRLAELTARHAEVAARRGQIEKSIGEADQRAARLTADIATLDERIGSLGDGEAGHDALGRLKSAADDAAAGAEAAEAAAGHSEDRLASCRRDVEEARGTLIDGEQRVGRIETEMTTLAKLIEAGREGDHAPLIDAVTVAPGFEAALGAAFGDDLDASADEAAAAHWRQTETVDLPPLPAGAEPLSAHVTAPAVVDPRLSQTGVVPASAGRRLQSRLRPGQRLVSREGDLWRWDGYVAGADAGHAAAQRLASRNRLAELDVEIDTARQTVAARRSIFGQAEDRMGEAGSAEREAREASREARLEMDETRRALSDAEREAGKIAAERTALQGSLARLTSDLVETEGALTAHRANLAAAPQPDGLARELTAARHQVGEDRSASAEARAALDNLTREAELRSGRLAAIAVERQDWRQRGRNAEQQIAILTRRQGEFEAERGTLDAEPARIEERRRALLSETGIAEKKRQKAADRLAESESVLKEADGTAGAALEKLAEAREQRGRTEERAVAAKDRLGEVSRQITEALECPPDEAAAVAELKPDAPLPDLADIEARLERYRRERERLGAVNLRADIEAEEIAERRDVLVTERDDLVAAIRRLRQGIVSLNREGRERLLVAFETVDGHFQNLFTHLFGGGQAKLQLTESDDPLEAGLEILARPPGKKPQIMTLLSGGEQALTALSLIFAVFLTNPAPVCVLDEVDAPLDDANVERFCDLLDEMSRQTETRFVVITHNPITMARMDRLFGVTMAERGVSQMVSVDLETAESYREAG